MSWRRERLRTIPFNYYGIGLVEGLRSWAGLFIAECCGLLYINASKTRVAVGQRPGEGVGRGYGVTVEVRYYKNIIEGELTFICRFWAAFRRPREEATLQIKGLVEIRA